MTDQNFEELAKLYPDLFQKARIGYIECDDGWFNILKTLAGLISHDVEQLRRQIAHYTEVKDLDRIPELERLLEEELENLPTISQVKEKFGSLRFYCDSATDKVYNWIQFAEEMSCITCEVCGAPGTHRNTGWIRTLCDKHAAKSQQGDNHWESF